MFGGMSCDSCTGIHIYDISNPLDPIYIGYYVSITIPRFFFFSKFFFSFDE